MAKGEPCARQISHIVDYILDHHKVKVSWRIVGLDDEEWSRVMAERSALDEASLNGWKQISELLNDPTVKKDEDIATLLKLREAVSLAKQARVEYGTLPSLADYLAADAMVVPVNETLTFTEKMSHLQPFTREMVKENRHVDFLIFINSSKFSEASHDEKLTILAHEAVHIVELVRNSQSGSFESIETKAEKLVSNFKERAEK